MPGLPEIYELGGATTVRWRALAMPLAFVVSVLAVMPLTSAVEAWRSNKKSASVLWLLMSAFAALIAYGFAHADIGWIVVAAIALYVIAGRLPRARELE